MQHLLSKAVWDTDAVAADLRDYVIEHLGEVDGVLVADETGDLKKGDHTVGVQRQYTGTARRIENAQVAVYLTYTARTGHAMIDRELYLPRSWAEDQDRRTDAGVPAEVGFATKPALAATMITRAVAAGVPDRWVTADEVYGADPDLRAEIERLGLGYVLAIGCNRRVATHGGLMRVDAIAAALPDRCWQRYSAGAGAKGPRVYGWAWIALAEDEGPDKGPGAHGQRGLLIRRHPDHGELAFYRCSSPNPVGLPELVRVAGARWSVEESFQAAKGLAGLDEHQARRWTSWRRWTLIAMLAHALLAVLAAGERARDRPRPRQRSDMDRLATTPPTPRPNQPLPHPTRDMITISGWSTRRRTGLRRRPALRAARGTATPPRPATTRRSGRG